MRIEYVRLYGNGIYCPAVDKGILLFGARGSGKTAISYELIQRHYSLLVGDDCIAIHPLTRRMSWGSTFLGKDRIAIRNKDIEEHDEVIKLEREKLKEESRLDVAVYLDRLDNKIISGTNLDWVADTWKYLVKNDVQIAELSVKKNIEKTVESLLRIIHS